MISPARNLSRVAVRLIWSTAPTTLRDRDLRRLQHAPRTIHALERFLLVDGAPYPALFWLGYVAVGSVVPLALVFHPKLAGPRATAVAAALVTLGAFALLYVFIIGGQAFPLEIFPGYEVKSAFRDGQVDPYAPSLPEFLLGIGGLAAAFLIALVGIRALPILPPEEVALPAAAAAK